MSANQPNQPTARELCTVHFEDRRDRHHCLLCPKSRAKGANGGYTNAMDHLERDHRGIYLDEYVVLARPRNTLDQFVRVTVDEQAMNAYQWMDWIVMDHHELTFCEQKRARNYSNLRATNAVTLKAQLEAVELVVQERIRSRLADKPVGLLVDAWTEASTHYAGVIALTPSLSDSSVSERILLCFSPFQDESDMSADAFIELLDYALDLYQLNASQLCFYVCDHASINTSVATRTRVPMIGCSSHRLQLAVQLVLEPYDSIITKVHALMVKLNGIKNRHKLRSAGALMAVLRNATRWSSTFAMIHRYFLLAPHVDRSDAKLVDVLLTPREELRLQSVFESLKKLESVSKRLQVNGQGQSQLSLY